MTRGRRARERVVDWVTVDLVVWSGYFIRDGHLVPTTRRLRFLAVVGFSMVGIGLFGYVLGLVPVAVEESLLVLRVVTDDTIGGYLMVLGLCGIVGAYSTRPGADTGGYILCCGGSACMAAWFTFGLAIGSTDARAVASAIVWGLLAYAIATVQALTNGAPDPVTEGGGR